MFGLFRSNESLNKDVSTDLKFDSDSDSDSDVDSNVTDPICAIKSNATIISNASGEGARVKFGRGSFAFSLVDDKSIALQFHPIFLWRMVLFRETIKNDEEIVDFVRLRSFVSQFMRKRGFDVCFTVSDCDVQYILDGIIVVKPVSGEVFTNAIVLFNKLHMSLSRRYDSCELIDLMLEAGFQVLRIVSGV
jgi:hypothetical protein